MTFDEPKEKKLRGTRRIVAEAIKSAEDFAANREQVLKGIASNIEKLFCDRAIKRASKDSEWQRALALYHAPLVTKTAWQSDDPFRTVDGRSRPVPNIIRTKCDAAIANGYSMQFASGERNWDLWPAANDDTVESVVACALMQKEIESQLDSCRYPTAVRKAMSDRVIFGTGVLKGPVNTGKLKQQYVNQGGVWVPKLQASYSPSIEYVPTYRFYPDMNVSSHEQSLADIELHAMTTTELAQLRYHPGFDTAIIEEILNKSNKDLSPDSYNDNFLSKLDSKIWESPYMYKDRYVVLEYHGPISVDQFEEIGMKVPYESPNDEYYGEVWVCCGRVIRIELENIEGACETPYAVAVWKTDPTSPFGFGHPLLLADAQRVVTQAYHMILDNASLTSGPQVAMYQNWIQPADGKYSLSPNKVWLLNDPTVKISDAISFFTPTNVIGNIMPVLELARMFAEEESATTGLATGLQSPQNAETASGQLVALQNGTPILDFMGEEWDDYVTEKNIRRMYAWNMQYNEKEQIKGNYSIDVRSSSDYKNKQMHIRDLERLSMEVSQNPALAAWINVDQLQIARLNLMKLPHSKIVRTKEEYAQAQQAMAQQPDPGMIELQIKMETLAVEKAKVALQQNELQFQMQQQQQREQWEHDERMGANMARLREADAAVLKASNEMQLKYMELMLRQEGAQMDAATKLQVEELRAQNKVFLEGSKAADKRIENMLVDRELDIKEEQGSGI